jgi:hypothetical protein
MKDNPVFDCASFSASVFFDFVGEFHQSTDLYVDETTCRLYILAFIGFVISYLLSSRSPPSPDLAKRVQHGIALTVCRRPSAALHSLIARPNACSILKYFQDCRDTAKDVRRIRLVLSRILQDTFTLLQIPLLIG